MRDVGSRPDPALALLTPRRRGVRATADLAARAAQLEGEMRALGEALQAIVARWAALSGEHAALLAALARREAPGRQWARASEAARLLGVDRSTVRRWARAGRLPSRRLGNTVLYRVSLEADAQEEEHDG